MGSHGIFSEGAINLGYKIANFFAIARATECGDTQIDFKKLMSAPNKT